MGENGPFPHMKFIIFTGSFRMSTLIVGINQWSNEPKLLLVCFVLLCLFVCCCCCVVFFCFFWGGGDRADREAETPNLASYNKFF